jgi:mRNA-degrading endonuclease RelE of RelBE toxin-antitoxin system
MSIEEYISNFSRIAEPKAKQLWVRDFKSVSTHIRGNKENDIIATKRPNEDVDIYKYRIANYRAVTKHPFNTALTNLVRIMNHPDVVIRYPERLFEYLGDTNFGGTDLHGYYRSKILRSMIEMANGLLVPWPTNVATDESELVNDLLFDIIVVNPIDIVHYNSDVLTFKSKEKSPVVYNKRVEMMGEVYYCIHRDGLWKRIQVGKATDRQFVWDSYYTNPTGEVYAQILGGDLTSDYVDSKREESIDYYTSFFASAIPFADECISQFSDHQGTLVSCSFPIREMDSLPCNAEGCFSGYITDANSGRHQCNSCHGTGRVPIAAGPYGIMLRPPNDPIDKTNNTDRSVPAIKFLHPDVTILEYGGKVWKDHLNDVKEALNLLFIDEAQSGTAKEIDREDKIATLDKIGKHLYDLLKNTVQIIHKFRFPNEDYPQVLIQLPSTFIEKTQSQKQEELKSLKDINAPGVLIFQKMRSLHASMVNNDPLEMRLYDYAAMVDPFYLKSFDEKVRLQAVGVIDEITFGISEMTPSIVRRIANNNPNILDLSDEQLRTLYDAEVAIERPRIEEMVGSRRAPMI